MVIPTNLRYEPSNAKNLCKEVAVDGNPNERYAEQRKEVEAGPQESAHCAA
jgi:hypothetical protein